MRSIVLSFILFLGISWLFPVVTIQGDDKSDEARLNNADAVQAMAIANEWKWSQKDVKSYITAREVVFEFSDGTKKEILLPEERMLVAVAPYMQRTHK